MKSSRDIIKLLNQDGWYLKRVVGSHHHFKHPTKPGTVTVPHPKKDFKPGTLNSILKQAGLK
ncbi:MULTISPECIES: type II toxin-antitoxin system HicA family toxin [Bacillus]|uniref:type II toxin-antitoxin system HicA family toxin n=1 Tax=Bacillus TaxID=1386 RepID=UPI001C24BE81|nr:MULTISPECIES: type II toxin-antitoxin system HicA family toxin [Bacillus]MBU8788839.1 type II toxin-antitoxin system HicA family toxin [Bacillus glycinifermentans]WPP35402.1 type II toxin-antitoxin system HicA family toxin [Bacillus sonorensis]